MHGACPSPALGRHHQLIAKNVVASKWLSALACRRTQPLRDQTTQGLGAAMKEKTSHGTGLFSHCHAEWI